MSRIVWGVVMAALVGIGVPAWAAGKADGSYAAKLAACRAAAEKADGATDFKCDWKAIVAGAPGAALTGRYTIIEKGLAGEMTVIEGGGGPALVAIATVTKDRNAHTCSLDVTGERDASDVLVLKSKETPACIVRIKSSRQRNVVEVTGSDDCRDFCGMRAGFDGKYRLRK
jgi:hypothetical protein